jgi:hypothetical protein
MLKRNILQVVLVVALSAFGQASAGTIVSSDTELGSSNEEAGLANRQLMSGKGKGKGKGKGGSKGKGKGKGKGGSKGKGKGKVS